MVFQDNAGTALALTGDTTNFASITANENVNVTAGGTIGTGGTVAAILVAAGKNLNFGTQAFSTAAGTGIIKNGDGILTLAGGTYAGGFTLNAGTVALSGINGMGAGGVLTINGGTIRSNGTAARDLTGKYTSISIGGNFTFGDTTNNGGLTFTNNMALGAVTRTITVNSAVTMGGIVSGSAGVGLTKNGAGTLRLNGANTLTGVVEVSNGILQIGSYTGLSTVSSLTVSGGGTSNLQLVQVGTGTTTNSINKALSLHGTLSIAGGSATNRLNQTWAGTTTLAGNSTITNNGNSSFIITGGVDLGAHTLTYQADGTGSRIDGNIIGSGGSLIKTSAQDLLLGGANTYSGATTVNAGTLTLSYATQDNSKLSDTAVLTLGGGTVSLGGATGTHTEVVASTTLTAGTVSSVTRSGLNTAVLQLGTITNNAGASINFGAPGVATTNNLNNSAGVLGPWATISGDGWAVNSTNGPNGLITGTTYTDVTRLDSGTKTIAGEAGNARIIEGTGAVGDVTMAAAGTTAVNTLVNAATTAGTLDIGAGNTLSTSAILQGTGAGALTVGISATPGSLTALTAGGDLSVVANAAITINSTISNQTSASSLTKYGTGTLTLTGNSDYSGATTVNQGTLAVTSNNALGSTAGATTINGGNGTNGITLSLSSATTGLTLAENLNFVGNAGGRTTLLNNSAQNHTLTGGIDVSSDTNLTQFTSTGTGSITISGDLTGTMTNTAVLFLRGESTSATNQVTGNVNLTGGNLAKTDGGTWLVGAAGKTYSWVNTLVAGGTLKMGLAGVLPSSAELIMGNPTGGSTPILDLNGFSQTVAGLVYNGHGTSTGTRTITSATPAVLTVNNATDYLNVGTNVTTNNIVLTGAVSLVKEGAGIQRFSGANTNTGTTTVNGGILSLNNNAALQNSALVTTGAGFLNLEAGITTPSIGGLSGATGNLATLISAGYGSVTALTLRPVGGTTVTYGGVIADGAAGMTLTKTAAGTQVLTNANTFTGNVTITGTATANTLRIEHAEALGLAATVKNITPTGSNRQVSILELANNITVDANKTITTAGKSYMLAGETAFGSPVFLRNASGNNTWLGNILIANSGGAYSIESAAGSTLNVGLNPATSSVIRNDVATSTRPIEFRGAGEVVLNSRLLANGASLTGLNQLGTGTLTIPRTDNDFANVPNLAAGTTVVENLANTGTNSSLGNGTQFNLGGTLRHVGSAASSTNRGLALIGKDAVIESSGTGTLGFTSTGSMTFTTGTSGTFALAPSGSTVMTAVDVWNLAPGMTVAGTGIVAGTKIAAINYDTREVTLDTATNAATTTHTAVTYGGAGDLDRTLTLEGSNTGSNTFSLNLVNPTDGTGKLGLNKAGAGSWTISGTNTYTGPTVISGGTLMVNSTQPLATGAVTLATGATLGGSGTLGGLVTTAGVGSVLSPGNSPGSLILNGGLDVSAGATFNMEVGTPATDVIVIGGTFTGSTAAGGLLWNLSDAGGLLPGTPYSLLTFAASTGLDYSDLAVGTLGAGMTLDPAFGTGGFLINSDSLQVQFAGVPEPTTTVTLLAGLGFLLGRRRRA